MNHNQSESQLARVIGPAGLAVATVNAMIGGGIYRAPAAASALGGPFAIWAYVLCAVVMSCTLVCIMIAGRGIDRTGGPYAYVFESLGPTAAYSLGVLSWLGLTLGAAAISAVLADSAAAFWPVLAAPAARTALLFVVIGTLAAVNVRGVAAGHRLNVLLGFVKILPLLLVVGIALVLMARGRGAAAPVPMPPGASVLRATTMVIFMFAGIEMALYPTGEMKGGARTLRLGVGSGWLVVCLILAAVQLAAVYVLGPELPSSQAPLLDVVQQASIPAGSLLVLVGTCVSVAGCVAAVILSTPRLLLAMAEDNLLPERICRIHPRFHTPHAAIIVQAAVAWVLASSNGFAALVSLVSLCCLSTYLLSVAAALRKCRSHIERTFCVVTGIALLVIAASTPLSDLLKAAVFLAAALLVRKFAGSRRPER